jgi:hypothetical protein
VEAKASLRHEQTADGICKLLPTNYESRLNVRMVNCLKNKITFDKTFQIYFHIKWDPIHHGMARPQVADGGDGFQI